jgi:hypothetical protein
MLVVTMLAMAALSIWLAGGKKVLEAPAPDLQVQCFKAMSAKSLGIDCRHPDHIADVPAHPETALCSRVCILYTNAMQAEPQHLHGVLQAAQPAVVVRVVPPPVVVAVLHLKDRQVHTSIR